MATQGAPAVSLRPISPHLHELVFSRRWFHRDALTASSQWRVKRLTLHHRDFQALVSTFNMHVRLFAWDAFVGKRSQAIHGGDLPVVVDYETMLVV